MFEIKSVLFFFVVMGLLVWRNQHLLVERDLPTIKRSPTLTNVYDSAEVSNKSSSVSNKSQKLLQLSSLTKHDLAVIVLSARDFKDRRNVIRETWGNGHSNVFFIVGKHCPYRPDQRKPWVCEPKDVNAKIDEDYNAQQEHLTTELSRESNVIVVDMIDVYRNLAEKLKLTYMWLVEHTEAKYVLKMDDDSFARVDSVQHWLANRANPAKYEIIAGKFNTGKPIRSGKWAETKYKPNKYPPWPSGSGHIVSRPVIEYLYHNADTWVSYQGEDTSIGIWMEKVRPQMNLVRTSSKHFITHSGDCHNKNKFVIGHKISIQKLRECYNTMDEYDHLSVAKAPNGTASEPDDKAISSQVTISGKDIVYDFPENIKTWSGIVFGILSGGKGSFEKRQSVRDTWCSNQQCLFILAGPFEDIRQEYEETQDIIWLDIPEGYLTLTYKTQIFMHIVHNIDKLTYAFKTDDDSFVFVERLKKELTKTKPDYWGRLFHNARVNRNPNHKWYISVEEYPDKYFPDYCSGTGYALSTSFLKCAVTKFQTMPFMKWEDVATGMLAKRCNIAIYNAGKKVDNNGKTADMSQVIIKHYVKTKEEMIKHYNSASWKDKTPNTMSDAMNNTFEVSPKMDIENTVKIQHRLLYMLTHFTRIAEKHDIKYWLCAGTLIGAIRHKGFIPWDADIDISIPLDSYKTFKSVASKEFPSDLWLQTPESDSFYKFEGLPKIRDLNSDYEGYSKNHKDWHNGIQIDLIVWNDGERCHFSKSTCCSPKNQVYPVKRVAFENVTVNVPQKSIEILNNYYGNIDIQPVKKRVQHQGKAIFYAPDWVKKKYPQLYNSKEKNKPEVYPVKTPKKNTMTDAMDKPMPEHSCPASETKKYKILSELIHALDEVDCPYNIHGGTLLAFVRDCVINDYDIDIAIPIVWRRKNEASLTKSLEKYGFEKYFENALGTIDKFGYETTRKKGGIRIDLFSRVDEPSRYLTGLWKSGKVYKCPAYRKTIGTAMWGDLQVRVPIPYDTVLSSWYGKDWKKPFKGKWRWFEDAFKVGSCIKSSVANI